MINKMIKKVLEFHDSFGVKRGNVDAELRYKLFKEEFDEHKDAKDLVEKTDAICDMLYIACGTLDVHGWYFVKLPLMTANNEHEILKVIERYNEEYLDVQLNQKIANMIHCILDLANHIGIYDKLSQLFNEVHASNMSKLDENGKPIINDGVIDPRKPVGKVLKGKNYFEPKLKEILKRYERIK